MRGTGRRERLARIRDLLDASPDLRPRYETAKEIVRAFRRPAFYEVATRCNLFCEGCYYFADDFAPRPEERNLDAWRAFFAAEAARGVTMAYFVGAEPALEHVRHDGLGDALWLLLERGVYLRVRGPGGLGGQGHFSHGTGRPFRSEPAQRHSYARCDRRALLDVHPDQVHQGGHVPAHRDLDAQ